MRLRRVWLLLFLFSLPLLAQYSTNSTPWTIVRADYGAGNSWHDVTSQVQSLVRGDALNFTVDNQTLGGDPAPEKRKSLRLQVRGLRGNLETLTFNERSIVSLRVAVFQPRGWGWGALRITKAQYGAGARVRDVTQLLSSQIQSNQISLRVSNSTMGGDPAEGSRKSLTVWYTYRGRISQTSVNEGGTLSLGGGAAQAELRIVRADYGAAGRFVDVSSRLNSQIQGDRLSVRVTNETMGGDPAEERAKTLYVFYSYNGRLARAAAEEKGYLNIPSGTPNYVDNLQIMRAQYGADYRFHDVTELLNQQIQNDRLNLRITNETMGGDPAEERPKKLTVFYVYNGEPGQITVNEKDTLDLPGTVSGSWPSAAGELQILRAIYGVPGLETDVTDRLASRVQGDQLLLQVNSGTMGGDPAAGRPKRLKVVYLWQGLRYETNIPENGTVSLP
ncbi:MAG: DUF3395 domain-containing protein [Acidobacteriia bacterium]|nr:DUF3395 domain-containing protein [Terriglobia bacterium]